MRQQQGVHRIEVVSGVEWVRRIAHVHCRSAAGIANESVVDARDRMESKLRVVQGTVKIAGVEVYLSILFGLVR